MRLATTAKTLWREPFPGYVEGRHFLRWVVDPDLAGIVIWGSPSARDAQELVALLEAEVAEVQPRADIVVDFRHAKSINAQCFATMRDHIARCGSFYATHQEREVLLRPAGFVGTIVSGFYSVVTEAHYESAVFTELDDGLKWLGRAEASRVVTQLSEVAVRNAGSPPLLARVRNALDEQPGATLEEAARIMRLPRRTLQHHLRQAGTTFRKERDTARLSTAKRLLETTDSQIGTIGLEVGCATPQHFSDWFRGVTGYAPSSWRQRHRTDA